MDQDVKKVMPQIKEVSGGPGKTYLRLLSTLEGYVKINETEEVHALFLVVEDLAGNQGVCPVVCHPNHFEAVRKAFQRIQPLALYAMDVDPEVVEGKRYDLKGVELVDDKSGPKDKMN